MEPKDWNSLIEEIYKPCRQNILTDTLLIIRKDALDLGDGNKDNLSQDGKHAALAGFVTMLNALAADPEVRDFKELIQHQATYITEYAKPKDLAQLQLNNQDQHILAEYGWDADELAKRKQLYKGFLVSANRQKLELHNNIDSFLEGVRQRVNQYDNTRELTKSARVGFLKEAAQYTSRLLEQLPADYETSRKKLTDFKQSMEQRAANHKLRWYQKIFDRVNNFVGIARDHKIFAEERSGNFSLGVHYEKYGQALRKKVSDHRSTTILGQKLIKGSTQITSLNLQAESKRPNSSIENLPAEVTQELAKICNETKKRTKFAPMKATTLQKQTSAPRAGLKPH